MTTSGNVNNQVDVNSGRVLAASILMHTVGPQVLYILPAFVQGLKEHGGFDEKQAGFLASAETLGITLGTIAIILLQSRINWRHIFTATLLLVIGGNIASALAGDFETFRLTRYLTGFGAGCILSLSYVVIALSDKHDRNFGLMIMVTLVYAALLVFLLPTLYGAFGFKGLVLLVALTCVAGLFFIRDLPVTGQVKRAVDKQAINLGAGLKVMGLASILVYFLAMGGVWSYLFLIGTSGGASEQSIANAISISQFFGMAGAFTAAMLGIRYGRSLPLAVTIVLIIVSILLMLPAPAALVFTLLVCLFYYNQCLSHPYLLGSMASFDRSGKLVAYAATLTSLGYAFGSYIAASIIPGDGTYDEVIWMAALFFAVSLVLILVPNQVYVKRKRLLQEQA